jgi:asparagine synthetase A
LEAQQIAERARADARAVGERTERRIRAVTGAFERELGSQLAAIEVQAAAMSAPHVPRADELASLQRAVQVLAGQLTGAGP